MQIDFNNIQNEKKRWEFIYDNFYQSLCYFSNTVLQDPEKAQDVVQSVLVKLWQDKTVFNDVNHLRNFLYKSVRNSTINELNTTATHEKILGRLADNNPKLYEQDDHFHSIVRAELYKRILDEVSNLPDKTAEVFRLAFLEQKSNQEIADQMSISINTVKVHKNNAKKALQHTLKDLFPLVALMLLNAFQ